MTHFAKLDVNNVVECVLPGRQEDEGKEIELSARTGDVYKQTSYNTRGGIHLIGGIPFRKNFAGIGYFYDGIRDAFIPPQNYPSWTLNEDSCLWEAPTPMPNDGAPYAWNESTISWDEIVVPSV